MKRPIDTHTAPTTSAAVTSHATSTVSCQGTNQATTNAATAPIAAAVITRVRPDSARRNHDRMPISGESRAARGPTW